MIAEVVFNLPLERGFHYLVPTAFERALQPRIRVLAPFGRRRLVGMVHRVCATTPIANPKPILRVLDQRPVLTPSSRRLAEWMATTYCCSLGEAYACLVPSALRIRFSASDAVPPVSERPLATPAPADLPAPNAARQAGLPELTAEQQAACARIQAALVKKRPETFLLYGVTSSGKTEVYLRVIAEALAQGRSAIVLVPEIALTPQTIDWFTQRFGSQVAVWHSRLSRRQRAEAYRRLAEGRCRIVVGTRSAIFAPVEHLGLVVVDEEHDPSYKQNEVPRYHAREVAIARARLSRGVVILGSATPSLESFYQARRGRVQLLQLTERVRGRPLPKVEVVDMRQESGAFRRTIPLSMRLQLALQRAIDTNEQAILLLNRRGFARTALCLRCGAVVRCSRCSVPLVYHASQAQLQCHYCGFHQPPPETCPACGQGYLRFRGAGTQRIESELHRLFPVADIGRMDRDSTKPRESPRQIYEAIKTHLIDVLVGTQMVAKGWDIPQVTLVGVISADTALNLPDFRAGERTFDLLTQVAGRAGRGDRPGHVVIQTFCPEHYAIQAAAKQDYEAFYEAEIRMRKRLRLPPLTRLVELTVHARSSSRAQELAQQLAEALSADVRRARSRVAVLGPAPHRLARLRGAFRWRIVLKAPALAPILALVRRTLRDGRRFQGMPVIVDVDPL